jgi:hypothetical protein
VSRNPAGNSASDACKHDRRGGRSRPTETGRRRAARIGDLRGERLQRGKRDQAMRDRGGGVGEGLVLATGAPATGSQPRQRQQRRELAGAPAVQLGIVEAGQPGVTPAGLAVRQMASDLSALTNAQRPHRASIAAVDHRAHMLAAASAD